VIYQRNGVMFARPYSDNFSESWSDVLYVMDARTKKMSRLPRFNFIPDQS
jgi:hypothetical protein